MLENYKKRLKKIKQDIKDIGDGLVKSNETILQAVIGLDIKKLKNSKSYIKNISNKTDHIDNNIISTLALHSPEARDLRTMIAYLKITHELQKTSSNIKTVSKGFVEVLENLDHEIVLQYIKPMLNSTLDTLKTAINMINMSCNDEIRENFDIILVAENKTEDLYEIIETDIIKKAKDICDFDTYHNILKTLRKIKKISERASSIANLLLYANHGGEIVNI